MIRIALVLAVIITNIGCDQVSKNVIRNTVSSHENIGLLGNHLTVMRVENSGAFLSLGDSLPAMTKTILLSALPLLVLTFIFIYVLAKHRMPVLPLIGLCCIIGGGIGNIFDRITYGSVTDFLHIDLGLFRTGIFNMADVSVVVGTLLIFIHSFAKRRTHGPVTGQENIQ